MVGTTTGPFAWVECPGGLVAETRTRAGTRLRGEVRRVGVRWAWSACLFDKPPQDQRVWIQMTGETGDLLDALTRAGAVGHGLLDTPTRPGQPA